jgi:hypothetical protein
MIQEVGGEVGQEGEAGGKTDATQQHCCIGRTDLVKITTASMPHGETPLARNANAVTASSPRSAAAAQRPHDQFDVQECDGFGPAVTIDAGSLAS